VPLADALGRDRARAESVLVEECPERISDYEGRQLLLSRLGRGVDDVERRHCEGGILSSRGKNCVDGGVCLE